jgi:hypothetical protein
MSDRDLPSRDVISAFLDGELPAAEVSRLEALRASNKDFAAYIAQQEALRADLQSAYSAILNEPVPERLLAAAQGTPLGWRARWRGQLAQWSDRFTWQVAAPAAAAVAIGLIVGVALGRVVLNVPSGNDQILASATLATVLNDHLASNQPATAPIRIGLSFRSKSGQDCRTFTMSGASTVSDGIACHVGNGWVVANLTTTPERPNEVATYQMAAAPMPDAIRRAVASMIAGEPFDADAERSARARGWQEPAAR